MKFPPLKRTQRVRSQGFTLVELLTVITIIAILAGMVLGGSKYARLSAARKKTQVQIAAISTALERFLVDHGEYPTGVSIAGQSFSESNSNGAKLLYQALTGDGGNLLNGGSGSSNGVYTDDDGVDDYDENYLTIADVNNLTQGMVSDEYGLIDAFGKPYQYRTGDDAQSINSTYDLWSWADAESFTVPTSSNGGAVDGAVITNW